MSPSALTALLKGMPGSGLAMICFEDCANVMGAIVTASARNDNRRIGLPGIRLVRHSSRDVMFEVASSRLGKPLATKSRKQEEELRVHCRVFDRFQSREVLVVLVAG